jgi:hypothetical protein
MRNLFVVLGLVLLMNSLSWGYTTSDYSWINYEGHSYALTMDYGNWTSALLEVQAIDAHFLTVNTAEENAWIVANFDFLGPWESPTMQAAWIGYHYDVQNDVWIWESGEPVTYINLSDWGQNIVGDHMYMHTIDHPDAGKWNNNGEHDVYSSHVLYGIIETSIPIPVPGTILLSGFGLSLICWLRKRSIL